MMIEIPRISNAMIGKAALPDFKAPADKTSESVGVSSLNELNRALNSYVISRSEQEIHVIGHQNERMEEVTPLPSIVIKRL